MAQLVCFIHSDLSADSAKSSHGGIGTGNKLTEYARQTVVPQVFSGMTGVKIDVVEINHIYKFNCLI